MSETGKTLIIGAGGTGGHMFPASAFAGEMRRRGWRVGLVSDVRGLRYGEKFPANWKEETQAASPNFRKFWTVPGAALKINAGISRAKQILRENDAALVAGFGGYPSFPLMAAARRSGVPILIHEQNAVLGRVNRQFAGHAKIIASGFERLDRLPNSAAKRHVAVGNPVRDPIVRVRDTPFPSTDGKLTIFITGGSQGAQILGQAVPLAITEHLPDGMKDRVRVVQQVRAEQMTEVVGIYARAGIEAEIESFFGDMPERLAAAHLIIARSGAGTVSEIAAVGRPSILIPLKTAMDDHQTANAEGLVDVGAADLLMEDNLYPVLLGGLIGTRLSDLVNLRERAELAKAQGRVEAASTLADLAEGLV